MQLVKLKDKAIKKNIKKQESLKEKFNLLEQIITKKWKIKILSIDN